MGSYVLSTQALEDRCSSRVFYVDRRVFISVVMCATFRTCPFTDIQVKMLAVFHDVATVTTCLCRVFRRHFSKKPAIKITLVGDFGKKHSPPCSIRDCFCKLMVFQQVLWIVRQSLAIFRRCFW